MESDHQHRRQCSRVKLHLRAELLCPGAAVVPGIIANLGLQGGFLHTETPPEEGSPCQVRVFLDGTDQLVCAIGRVLRHGPGGCAFRFEELIGLESLDHLRNLVLYNSDDPRRVEQEMHDHLGLRPG